jgi:peptidoglycan/LPS O-acetylase OafA/YrhL
MVHDSLRLKRNNFDLLRVVLASIVLLVHSYQLSGLRELRIFRTTLSAELAVQSFFIVSGFLIFMSYERSSSLKSYISKRLRRIYPAYFTIVLLCAFSLAALSSLSIGEYFSSPTWWKYLLANLTFMNFIQPTLPGVFAQNVEPFVNGALWTLKIEMMFYISVPIIAWLIKRTSPLLMLAVLYGFSFVYTKVVLHLAETTGSALLEELAHQLPAQLAYFMSGAFFYYYLPTFEKYVGYFMAAAIAVLLADHYLPLPYLTPFALATVVAFAGLYVYLGKFGKYGDFSYGLYIVHFPIIQTLISLQLFPNQPWQLLATGIVLSVIGAVLMWHLVEKRFLARSSHYVAAVKAAA